MNSIAIKYVKVKKTLIILCLFIASSCILFAHDGHHTNKAWKACDKKKLSDSCRYVLQDNMLYKGTCRQVQEDLLCVRNQPIERL